jgi:hypothetical protein
MKVKPGSLIIRIMKIKFSPALVSLSLFLIPQLINSQDLVRSTGTWQIELTIDKSRSEVQNKAKELATIDALEKAFGRAIIQGNATYISNLQTGNKVETNTVFNTIANTSVKGEVQKEIDVKFTDVEGFKIVAGKKEKVTDIRCDIEIMAREIVTPPVAFTSFPLACLDEKCKTTSFKHNDDFYMFFSSPLSGYITIYLDQMTETQCLYPYPYMPAEFEGGVPVEADKKYFLFSDKHELEYFKGKSVNPQHYHLESTSPQDMNRLFIIFSKTPLNKPSLKDLSAIKLDKKEYDQGYRLPKQLPSEDFQRWLNTYRSSGKDNVQVAIIDITITK